MTRLSNLTGKRFGGLTVIGRADDYVSPSGIHRVRWNVLCDCGQAKSIVATCLVGGESVSCGCRMRETGHLNRKQVVTYGSQHTRLKDQRGSASAYLCVDCAGSADEWSYDHNDPNEVSQTVTLPRGRQRSVRYSTDVEHYQPRCKPCHAVFDQEAARV